MYKMQILYNKGKSKTGIVDGYVPVSCIFEDIYNL